MNKNNKQSNGLLSDIKSLVLSSMGRLPASLVVVLVLSVVMALLSGIVLEVMRRTVPEAQGFMPQRIEATDPRTLDLKKLRGNWVYQTPEFAMTLTLTDDDRFEWIIVFGNIHGVQYYARGNYRMVGDVLILGVRPDLGKPYDPDKPWLKILPMAMKDLNTQIHLDGASLLWSIPRSEQKKIRSQSAAIFTAHEDGRFTWVKP